jgi:hypothetical protein
MAGGGDESGFRGGEVGLGTAPGSVPAHLPRPRFRGAPLGLPHHLPAPCRCCSRFTHPCLAPVPSPVTLMRRLLRAGTARVDRPLPPNTSDVPRASAVSPARHRVPGRQARRMDLEGGRERHRVPAAQWEFRTCRTRCDSPWLLPMAGGHGPERAPSRTAQADRLPLGSTRRSAVRRSVSGRILFGRNAAEVRGD